MPRRRPQGPRFLLRLSVLPSIPEFKKLTTEVGGVDIESKYCAGTAKADDAPSNGKISVAKMADSASRAHIPIIQWVVTARFPAAEQCALGAELPLEARRGLMRACEADVHGTTCQSTYLDLEQMVGLREELV